MKLFKSAENRVFAFEADGSQDDLIGELVPISEAEADVLRNPPAPTRPPVPALQQIASLESATLLPRVTREFMLTFFAAQAAANGVDPMTSPAFAKLKALDDQIAVLRRAMV